MSASINNSPGVNNDPRRWADQAIESAVPQGSDVPSDVLQAINEYNQQLTDDVAKWEKLGGEIQVVGKNLTFSGSMSLNANSMEQQDQLLRKMQDLRNKAIKDAVDKWAQDLKRQGTAVPADLGTGEAALQKLGSLQYGVDLDNRSGLRSGGVYQGSITAQLMSAWLDRTNLLDKSLSSQLKDMQDKNKLLADANNVMSDLRSARPADSDDKKQVPSGIVTWAREHGVSVPDGVAKGDKVKQAVWDQFIQNIKSYVDNNNNDSQLMMVRLQDIQQKRDNAFELVSNLVKKLGSVDEQIISGMR